jgi:hypothetical protein
MLQAREIDWWTLAAQAIGTFGGILVRMAQSDINAPLDILNRNNR